MARRRGGQISVYTEVEIDVSDVLEEIDDEDLLEEVKRRKLQAAEDGQPTDMEMVREAYDELLAGRPAEARSILDRLLFPKWRNVEQCKAALAALTANPS